jgi:Cu(I)/Ag(I) efflux system membrane fusion protein
MPRAIRWALYATLPIAAATIAYFATRGPAKASATPEHAHGAAPASSAAQPVMLSSAEAQRIGVTYAVAALMPMRRDIRTAGQVITDETRIRSVSLRVDGWVEQLFVNFVGQSVDSGTPLLAISSPMLVTAQEELVLAKKLESEVSGGAPEARASAATLLASARARLAYWGVPAEDVTRIEKNNHVERALTLRAPVSGYVIEKSVVQGQRVMAGDALFRIADLSMVWVEGDVFEQDQSSVHLGQTVLADFDALEGRPLRGTIAFVQPTLDPETRTTRVRVELINPGLRLKPGMYATLRWSGTGVPSALSVPRSAVVSTGERHLVFVKRADGMLEPRNVDIGMATDDRIQILRGLVAGDTVVASATFLVDAESNLGAAFGGMGDMPGMDIVKPRKPR